MSINISSYSSISSRKGVSGLLSGLNTDELVEQLTSGTRARITKQLQNKQVLEWKQSAYRNVTTQLSTFYNKYFQYSSSSQSIMNSKFFNSYSITSSSSNVSVTGDSSRVENIVIKDIQQLADKAGFTSSHSVSRKELSSGTVYEDWSETTAAGNSIGISYGGKSYSIAVSSSFYLNSNDGDSVNIDKLVSELNAQITKNSELNGKLEFSVDASGAIKLAQTGGTTGDIKIIGGSNNLLTSLGLYKTEGDGVAEISGAYKLEAKSLFESNIFAGTGISLNLSGATNDVTLALAGDFRFSAQAMEKDELGNFTSAAKAAQKTELQEAYNNAINNNLTLKDKLSVLIGDNLEMTITALGDDATLKITGGDEKLLAGLGLSVTEVATTSVTGQIDVATAMSAKTKQLEEVLSGTTLSFGLNGITKKIEFKESEKEQYSTVEGLKNYIQQSLNKSYGEGKITVTQSDGKLGFTTADTSHTITLYTSSAAGILGENGALHTINGESNRAELVKTIDQIKDSLATPLVADADGKYRLNVNGKDFEFTGDTLFGDVMSIINNDEETGVTITYSSITDKISVVARESGSQGRVEIAEVGTCNLAAAIFGTNGNEADGYTIKNGNDFSAVMSFDGGNTFTTVNRSSNSFEMDGAVFEIKGMAEGTAEENVTFKVNNDANQMVDKITQFINEYNKIVELIQGKITEKRFGVDYDSKEKYLPLTDDQKEKMSEKETENWENKAQLGLLANDSTLNSILTKMRRAMSEMVGDGNALSQIGITTGEWKTGGMLIIDESKLRSALAKNPDKITRIFTGDDGIASKLQSVLKEAVIGNENGVGTLVSLAGKSTSSGQDSSMLSKQIKSITDAVSTLKNKLKTEEKRYFNKFSQLETLLGKLNAQSEYFSSLTT